MEIGTQYYPVSAWKNLTSRDQRPRVLYSCDRTKRLCFIVNITRLCRRKKRTFSAVGVEVSNAASQPSKFYCALTETSEEFSSLKEMPRTMNKEPCSTTAFLFAHNSVALRQSVARFGYLEARDHHWIHIRLPWSNIWARNHTVA